MEGTSSIRWQRSPRCESSCCVEVASVDGSVAIRDSKRPDGPYLLFSREEWNAFAAAVRAQDFMLD